MLTSLNKVAHFHVRIVVPYKFQFSEIIKVCVQRMDAFTFLRDASEQAYPLALLKHNKKVVSY